MSSVSVAMFPWANMCKYRSYTVVGSCPTQRHGHRQKRTLKKKKMQGLGFGRQYKTNFVLLSFVTTSGMCQKEGQKIRSYRETEKE
jgi:hypothetical protein